MKTTLLIASFSLGLITSLTGRTWTSADGKRTFEGELKAYDKEKGAVTVVLPNGQELSFTLDKLSAADRKFLESAKEGPAKLDLSASLSKEGVVTILKDGKYAAHKFTKKPNYFLLYYSASW